MITRTHRVAAIGACSAMLGLAYACLQPTPPCLEIDDRNHWYQCEQASVCCQYHYYEALCAETNQWVQMRLVQHISYRTCDPSGTWCVQ